MANELKHGSVGTELTQAEWEAVGAHVVANQAIGDIIFADTTTQLLRLGIGSTDDVLRVTGGKPDWQATSFITSLGTIATGVWQGTDVGVAYGGTGASTLTDGGVLLGSGTNAITAMAVLTDGQMIVGNGSTDPVAESGATLRTSIGVGTGDSPSFTALTLDGDLDFTGPQAVTTTSGEITLNAAGFGVVVPNGDGMVIGHTAQITSNNGVDPLQVLGTGGADSAAVIGRWSANNGAPSLEFMKSHHATVGSHSPVLDDDRLGEIKFVADVNDKFTTLAAMLRVEVDDATPAENDTGAAYVFMQAGGGVSLRETMRLDAAGDLSIASTTGSSSSTTGALVVAGGLGIAEDIYMAGQYFNMKGSYAGGSMDMVVQNTATAANSHVTLNMLVDGTDTTSDIRITMRRQVGTDGIWSFGMDNSNSQGMVWSSGAALGTNDRMRLAIATGVLSVDGDGGGSDDPVSLFDSYDDAALARSFAYSHPMAPEMGLVSRDQWEANRALMVEIGVAEWAEQEGGPDALMYNIQPMMRMLAGGIYQTRAQLVEEVTSLRRELAEVDSKLNAIGV